MMNTNTGLKIQPTIKDRKYTGEVKITFPDQTSENQINEFIADIYKTIQSKDTQNEQ